MAVPFYNQVSFGHGGDTAGSHAITSYNTKEDYSVSMIINGEEYHHNEFGAGILSMIYDADYTYPKFGNDVTPEKFKNYIGPVYGIFLFFFFLCRLKYSSSR